MAKSKRIKANKKVEENIMGDYKEIEKGVVNRFNKISDKFVDNYLTKNGESVEEAKKRLSAEQKAREEKSKKKMEERKPR